MEILRIRRGAIFFLKGSFNNNRVHQVYVPREKFFTGGKNLDTDFAASEANLIVIINSLRSSVRDRKLTTIKFNYLYKEF